ncbi:MAG: hypothetical protein Fur0022_45790 [Anaerolineales bacterium]
MNLQNRNVQTLQQTLAWLAEKYKLVAIYSFGSRAKEMWERVNDLSVEVEFPDSDLDIGVLPETNSRLDLDGKVNLALALEEAFNVSRVDLIVLPEARPFLALDVVRGELLYVSNKDAESEYQLYVLRRAGDLAPLQQERMRMVLAGEAY